MAALLTQNLNRGEFWYGRKLEFRKKVGDIFFGVALNYIPTRKRVSNFGGGRDWAMREKKKERKCP